MAQPPLNHQFSAAKTIILAESQADSTSHPALFQVKELLKSAPDSPWQVGDKLQLNLKIFTLLGRAVKTGQQAILFFLANNQDPFEMLIDQNGQFKYAQDDPAVASNLTLAEIKEILKK